MTDFAFNVSSQRPTLTSGRSWENFHYYNRAHILGLNQACSTWEGGSTGLANGKFFNESPLDNRIITEVLHPTSCFIIDSGVTIDGPGNITFSMQQQTGYWKVSVWLGQWVRIGDITTNFNVTPTINYGQEIWARTGNKSDIHVPVNFIHNARIKGTGNTSILVPWNNHVLQSPLNNKTQTLLADSAPFIIMDITSNDYTSISSHKP